MSGLGLSLLCDAVCHKGNSTSQLASLGVREKLVKSRQLAAKTSLLMIITWMEVGQKISCLAPASVAVWHLIESIVLTQIWSSLISLLDYPFISVKTLSKTDINTTIEVCFYSTLYKCTSWLSSGQFSSTEVKFKELKCLLSQNLRSGPDKNRIR